MRKSVSWGFTLLALCACARQARPRVACDTRAAIYRSFGDVPRAYERVASGSVQCRRDCEVRWQARACELHADAVVIEGSGVTAAESGPAVAENGLTPRPGASTFGRRDEQGRLIGLPTPSVPWQRGTFLRWSGE